MEFLPIVERERERERVSLLLGYSYRRGELASPILNLIKFYKKK